MKYTMLLVILTILSVTVAAEGKKECDRTNGKAEWELEREVPGTVSAKHVKEVPGKPIETLEQCEAECVKFDACDSIYVKEKPFECWIYTGDENDRVDLSGFKVYSIADYKCVDATSASPPTGPTATTSPPSGSTIKNCGKNGKADWKVIKGKHCSGGTGQKEVSDKDQCQAVCETLKGCVAIDVYNNDGHFDCYTQTESQCEPDKLVDNPHWTVYKLKSKCNDDCGTNEKADWEGIKGKRCNWGKPQEKVSNKEQCQDKCVTLKGCVAFSFCEYGDTLPCFTYTGSQCEPNNQIDTPGCTLYKPKPKCNDDCSTNGKAEWEDFKGKQCRGGKFQGLVSDKEECQHECVELKGCVAISVFNNGDSHCYRHTGSECEPNNLVDSRGWTVYKLKPKCNDGTAKKHTTTTTTVSPKKRGVKSA